MDGETIELAGDQLNPHAFFVVFRTIADLIRLTGYDLDGNYWTDPPSQRTSPVGVLDLAAVRAILERSSRILTLTPQEGEMSTRDLRRRAEAQSIQVTWRVKRHGLEPSRIGRIGRILSTS